MASHLAQRLEQGEVVAILLSNRLEYVEICFAARRAGLYYVPVSTHLTAGEVEYILCDSGARLVFTESRFLPQLESVLQASTESLSVILVDVDADDAGALYCDLVSSGPVPDLPKRAMGLDFACSSGTTGKPKGIRHAMAGDKQMEAALKSGGWTAFFNLAEHSAYLSPAPLYHAAPLRFSLRCLTQGGTVIAMQRFDAEQALATTHAAQPSPADHVSVAPGADHGQPVCDSVS